MPSPSPTMLLFIVAEVLIAVSIAAAVLYFMNARIKIKLIGEKEKLQDSIDDLQQERSPDATQVKISRYLRKQMQITAFKVKDDNIEALTQPQIDLLELRKSFFGIELRMLKRSENEDDFWNEIFSQYEVVRPKPEVITLTETIEVEVPVPVSVSATEVETLNDDDSASSESSSLSDLSTQIQFDTKTAETDRLKNVINNQYDSIDELRNKIRDIESTGDEYSESPFVLDIKEHLKTMEMEQEQMSMCFSVMENENDRLVAMLKQMEGRGDMSENGDTISKMKEESDSIKIIAGKLASAEKLIKNLTNSNRELLQNLAKQEDAITALEEEMSGMSEQSNKGVAAELEQTKDLSSKLIRSNKEHLQCIAILESEIDVLRASSIDVTPILGTADADENSSVDKSELYAKIAELDLLQADYDSMKEKYLKLFQESRAS